MFELTEQVVGHLIDARIRMLIAQTLDAGDKTRPGAGLKLIEHRSDVLIDGHAWSLLID